MGVGIAHAGATPTWRPLTARRNSPLAFALSVATPAPVAYTMLKPSVATARRKRSSLTEGIRRTLVHSNAFAMSFTTP